MNGRWPFCEEGQKGWCSHENSLGTFLPDLNQHFEDGVGQGRNKFSKHLNKAARLQPTSEMWSSSIITHPRFSCPWVWCLLFCLNIVLSVADWFQAHSASICYATCVLWLVIHIGEPETKLHLSTSSAVVCLIPVMNSAYLLSKSSGNSGHSPWIYQHCTAQCGSGTVNISKWIINV